MPWSERRGELLWFSCAARLPTAFLLTGSVTQRWRKNPPSVNRAEMRPRRAPRLAPAPLLLRMLGIEVLVMNGVRLTAHLQDTRVSKTSWRMLVRVSAAGGRQSAGWQRSVL